MTKRIRSSAWIGLSLGVLAWGLVGGRGRLAAQNSAHEVHGRLPEAGEEREDQLKRHYSNGRNAFGQLVGGKEVPTTPEQQTVIETAAKWFVYRVTWDETLRTGGAMEELVHEFEREALQPAYRWRDANEDFRKQFCQQLIIQLKKVLNNDFRVNRVRGGMLLRHLGQLDEEPAAELMASVIEDKTQYDEVKLFAVQGLQDAFAQNVITSSRLQRRCLKALLDFLAVECNKPEVSSAPEVAGAVRFIRRDILRALGQARLPRTKGEDPVSPALALLRFLVQEQTAPPSSLDERILTIASLSRLSRRNSDDYQPDYAAYYVAQFIMDFAKQVTASGRGDSFSKLHSAQLRQALDNFRTNSNLPNPDQVSRYVAAMVPKANSLLSSVDTDQPADPTELTAWLDNTKHSSSLFRGDKNAVVGGNVSMEARPGAPPAGQAPPPR